MINSIKCPAMCVIIHWMHCLCIALSHFIQISNEHRDQGDRRVDKQRRSSPLIYSREPKWTQMYVNIDGPFSLTLIGIRKTHFWEFSGGAAGLFNLRQQRSELSLPKGCRARRSLCEGNSIDWANSSFYLRGIFLCRPINRGTDSGSLVRITKNTANRSNVQKTPC